MDDAFKIYIEQLRDGHSERIDEAFDPGFLDIHEKEVAFVDPVRVRGHAYLADDKLVLNLDISTFVELPCVICNDPVKVEIKDRNFYHVEPLEEIRTGIYNFKDLLRETVLIDIPPFAECHQGKCPHRAEIAHYFKPEAAGGKENDEEEGYTPFANFDWDKKK
jgi:uncharacterized metal-binding protein YceD (DUF177 family)